MSFSPVRLNHAVLFVSDLERSVDFYQSVFGMEVITREERITRPSYAFLGLATIMTLDSLASGAPKVQPRVRVPEQCGQAPPGFITLPGRSIRSTSLSMPGRF